MRVEDVIRAARDRHPAFTIRQTPDSLLYRFIEQLQQRLLAQIADLRRDAIVSLFPIELPIEDFEAGVELPDHILIHGGDVHYPGSRPRRDLVIVGFHTRNFYPVQPTAYISGTHLFLLGDPGAWNEISSIDLKYFPRGGQVTGKATELVLPQDPLEVCAAACVSFMASRDTTGEVDKADFLAQREIAEARYMDRATGRNRATVSRIQEVW